MSGTVTRKVACAAHTWTTGMPPNVENHHAVYGEIVELPDDERTATFTEKGYLVDPDAELARTTVSAAEWQAMSGDERRLFVAANPNATVSVREFVEVTTGVEIGSLPAARPQMATGPGAFGHDSEEQLKRFREINTPRDPSINLGTGADIAENSSVVPL